MDEAARRFREQAALRNGERIERGRRYGKELQAQAREYARSRAREGVGLVQVADELGVSVQSLRRWTRVSNRNGAGHGLVAVEVVEDNGGGVRDWPVVLTTATGIRVEGLGVGELITVLRALR